MHFTFGIEGNSSRGFTGGSEGVIGINALPLRCKFAVGVLSGCILLEVERERYEKAGEQPKLKALR